MLYLGSDGAKDPGCFVRHIVDQLQLAGLSEREARVYITALTLGSASIQEIAHASQITRTTVYNLIESLVEQGLVSSLERDGKKLYSAEPPEVIVQLLRAKSDELLRRLEAVEDLLPELMALEKTVQHRPRMYMYEGKEGIRQLSRRYEECSGDFFEIVPYDALQAFIADHEFAEHREILTRNRIRGRVLIVAEQPPVEVMREMHDRHGWHIRYIGQARMPLSGQISVKGDEIYGVAFEGIPVGVVIENPPLAQALRHVFDMAWEAAPTDIAFPTAQDTK